MNYIPAVISESEAQGADFSNPPPPPPLGTVKAGRNHFEQVKYPPPPHWDRRAI